MGLGSTNFLPWEFRGNAEPASGDELRGPQPVAVSAQLQHQGCSTFDRGRGPSESTTRCNSDSRRATISGDCR